MTQLEMKRIINCVINTLMSVAQLAPWRSMCFQNFFDTMANSKVGFIHMIVDDKNNCNSQMMMNYIS
jgi:hypothetical protein